METGPKPLKSPDIALTAAIAFLDLAKDTTGVKPARDVFRSTSTLLTEIRVLFSSTPFLFTADRRAQDSMVKDADCVELGLTCTQVCRALDREINGRRQEEFSRPAIEAIERLNA